MDTQFVLRWPDKPGLYARLDYETEPWRADAVDLEEATRFADMDSAVLQALLIDSRDMAREWRGCVQEISTP